MSNYLAKNNAAESGATSKRRRKLWLVSGVAGLTGVVSIAAVGVAAAAGAVGTEGLRWSTAQQVSKDGDLGAAEREGHKGKKGEPERRGEERGKEVPCDSDKLIQAIVYANENHGGVLELARDCTYTLTRSDEHGNGLPVITENVVLKGHDTKIVRDAGARHFRILTVGRGGHLTAKGLTIKNGQTVRSLLRGETAEGAWSRFSNSVEATKAAEASQAYLPLLQAKPKGEALKAAQAKTEATTLVDGGPHAGGGVLVHSGGTATFEESHIVGNQAGGLGGGLANFGRTSLHHTTVADNTAFFYGGGIFNAGVLEVRESRVSNNEAAIGGGGVANGAAFIFGRDIDGGTVTIERAEVTDNEALGFGGGLLDIEGTSAVRHSKIANNTALLAGGGVAAAGDSNFELSHVEIAGNSTVGVGGGLTLALGAIANVEESKIVTNKAGFFGGGVFTVLSEATFRKSEISANRAVGPLGVGGGVFNVLAEIDLDKTRVAHNFATLRPGGVFNFLGEVNVDDKSAITANKPTNCEGSLTPVPRCFG
ncbi:hypothetical protein [Micromonospora endophytica]|uniref:Right handed beta helix domain-containing protein n=1 Tax=Micromonospora endophytica TaxID=515350 RepID=A0A2W2CTF5_9ACTN|nr:hypothetical protein [Micromonospora endophytica]PZF91679.1 hypothetical protein C1I93_20975 [Micromonospora endophytica]RIW40631.1 hypothetical protein D3H59_28760 [Micromonospora endophytica]BCJ61384.1 hypothetical protein Jiend_48060 [Micromonospora endophytica]